MEELLNKLYFYGVQYGVNLVGAVLIFFVGKWAVRLFSRLIEKLMIKAKVEKTLSSFVRHIVYFGLLMVVIIAALNRLGVSNNLPYCDYRCCWFGGWFSFTRFSCKLCGGYYAHSIQAL